MRSFSAVWWNVEKKYCTFQLTILIGLKGFPRIKHFSRNVLLLNDFSFCCIILKPGEVVLIFICIPFWCMQTWSVLRVVLCSINYRILFFQVLIRDSGMQRRLGRPPQKHGLVYWPWQRLALHLTVALVSCCSNENCAQNCHMGATGREWASWWEAESLTVASF